MLINENRYNFWQVSKVGVSALSILQQRTLDQERPGDDIVVNHVHPGWVPNTVEQKTCCRRAEAACSRVFFCSCNQLF